MYSGIRIQQIFIYSASFGLGCGPDPGPPILHPFTSSDTASESAAAPQSNPQGRDLDSTRNFPDSANSSNPLNSAVLQLIDQDWATLNSADKVLTRYISLSHLALKGQDSLRIAEFGVEKTLNSISRAPTMAKMHALDPDHEVFRISLNQFNLTPGSWDIILSNSLASSNVQTSPSGAPIVKGDWLVFAATRPEIYDKVLGIPPLESILEKSLGVVRFQPVYLGVSTSIVAKNPRILERLPIRTATGEGYYWRSYDFLLKSSAYNAIKKGDPTFAQSRSVTDLIAGEFIFSLPNGMQAYMLSGFGTQHRLDAVKAVAGDPRRSDGLVINGESCITCHSRGINARKDEVGPGLALNQPDPAIQARLRTLYPPQATLDALFAKDNAQFAKAIGTLGFTDIEAEPIGATIDLFLSTNGLTDVREQSGATDGIFKN